MNKYRIQYGTYNFYSSYKSIVMSGFFGVVNTAPTVGRIKRNTTETGGRGDFLYSHNAALKVLPRSAFAVTCIPSVLYSKIYLRYYIGTYTYICIQYYICIQRYKYVPRYTYSYCQTSLPPCIPIHESSSIFIVFEQIK